MGDNNNQNTTTLLHEKYNPNILNHNLLNCS